jgi:hypothetical protein
VSQVHDDDDAHARGDQVRAERRRVDGHVARLHRGADGFGRHAAVAIHVVAGSEGRIHPLVTEDRDARLRRLLIEDRGHDAEERLVVNRARRRAKLVSRVPQPGQGVLRRAGRINFRCDKSKGRYRVERLIEVIEFEYESEQKRGDTRLMVEVLANSFRIIR